MEKMQNMYIFRSVDESETVWRRIEVSEEVTIFHRKSWFEYLSEIYKYKPYIIEIQSNNNIIGYFCGVKTWKGSKILAAPPRGTGTQTQGLVMVSKVTE